MKKYKFECSCGWKGDKGIEILHDSIIRQVLYNECPICGKYLNKNNNKNEIKNKRIIF